MAEDESTSCVEPAAGPLTSGDEDKPSAGDATHTATEERKPMVSVGQKAPDFEAMAFDSGKFTKVKLSSFAGKWVFLCFYPGDFTFV